MSKHLARGLKALTVARLVHSCSAFRTILFTWIGLPGPRCPERDSSLQSGWCTAWVVAKRLRTLLRDEDRALAPRAFPRARAAETFSNRQTTAQTLRPST